MDLGANEDFKVVERSLGFYKTPLGLDAPCLGFTSLPLLLQALGRKDVEFISVSYDAIKCEIYAGGIFINGYQWISGPIPKAFVSDVLYALANCSRPEVRDSWLESIESFLDEDHPILILGDVDHDHHSQSLKATSTVH